MAASDLIKHLCGAGLAALALAFTGPAQANDRVEYTSERSFDDTLQQLEWAFGGYGLTTVTAMDFHQVLKKIKVQTGRAVMYELMRREWAKTLLREDLALGWLLPLRVYVFEQADGSTTVSYSRPGAVLETHQNEAVRALGRLLDGKLQAVVAQAMTKPKEQRQ
jgi:uncharacterized protein (DUF302 family)